MNKFIITSALAVAFLFVGCGENEKTYEEWKAYYKAHQDEAILKSAECKEKNIKPNSMEEAQNPSQEILECKAAKYAAWKRPIIGDEKDVKPWKNL